MKVAIISLILFALTVAANNSNQFQYDRITLADLPSDVFQEFMILLKGQQLTETLTCTEPSPSDIALLLYTRNNKQDPYVLNPTQPGPFTPYKKLIFIIHGWIQAENGYGMQELKNTYLDRYDANVVIVSWKNVAWDLYTRAVCKLPKVAKIVAKFIDITSKQSGIDLQNVHLVGHSLGGQMSGYIGQYIQMYTNQKIGKITGLDPAGPLFADAPIERRLDSSDANNVQVIHTNGNFFGYFDQCGHIDFFVNCGSVQPGCIIPDVDISDLLNLPIMAVGCSHFRAMDIMAESVRTNNFKGLPCQYCPRGCPPITSIFKPKTIMGEQCPPDARGRYFVLTNLKSPYAVVVQTNLFQ
ncbi:hypothetical protein FQR65_LT10091 [Abscondita terminalis]|nr:hypothetical protein FQR65_LT10091 [Abscondita terminalis]